MLENCIHKSTNYIVQRIITHDLFKLLLFILLSFLGAALISPQLYTWGKNLADYASVNELSKPIEWLAIKCERAQFSRYFNRSLMLSALFLLYPLIKSLKDNDKFHHKQKFIDRINPTSRGWYDIFIGVIFSSGLLSLLVILLYSLGWITLADDFVFIKAFKKAIVPAIIVSIIEEWLFRGVLYGVLVRKMSPAVTIIGLSLFFAAVHFLSPPKGISLSDPRAFIAGFEMLGLIGMKFLSLQSFLGIFITLFIVGSTLAYTRYKTGKIWLAIGLHAGWVFSLKFTNLLTDPAGNRMKLFYNDNLMEGVLPLLTLILTWLCLIFYLRYRDSVIA